MDPGPDGRLGRVAEADDQPRRLLTAVVPLAAMLALPFVPHAGVPRTAVPGRRLGDRFGQASLLVPGVVLSLTGMAALAATGSAATVLLGAAAFGAAFGILQNATLVMMYARAPLSAYSTVSAIWNAAYDLGMAVGAIGVGVLVSSAGFSAAFLLTAAAMLPALVLARREVAQPAEPAAELSPA